MANTLRGGKKIYHPKVKAANWEEDQYRPGVKPIGGFTTSRFVTTQHMAQFDVVAPPKNIGNALPKPDGGRFDYTKPVTQDTLCMPSQWSTVTQSVHGHPAESKATEFSTSFKLRGGLKTKEELTKYREEWTRDSELGAAQRFRTTTNTGLSCGPASKFKQDMLRKLPGAPLAVERLREKLSNDAGTFHIMDLRAKFKEFDTAGDFVLSRPEVEESLRSCGIPVPPRTDMDVIMSYFDKSGDGVVDCSEFISAVRGSLPPRRLRVVTEAFNTLDKRGTGIVTQADLEEIYEVRVKGDAAALGTVGLEEGGARHYKHNDHYSKFLAQWDVYEKDGKLTIDDFVEYYHDLSTLIKDDLYFEWMVRHAWGLSDNFSGDGSWNSRENLHHFEHHAGAVF